MKYAEIRVRYFFFPFLTVELEIIMMILSGQQYVNKADVFYFTVLVCRAENPRITSHECDYVPS